MEGALELVSSNASMSGWITMEESQAPLRPREYALEYALESLDRFLFILFLKSQT